MQRINSKAGRVGLLRMTLGLLALMALATRTPEALAMTLDYGHALKRLTEHSAERVARGMEPSLGL